MKKNDFEGVSVSTALLANFFSSSHLSDLKVTPIIYKSLDFHMQSSLHNKMKCEYDNYKNRPTTINHKTITILKIEYKNSSSSALKCKQFINFKQKYMTWSLVFIHFLLFELQLSQMELTETCFVFKFILALSINWVTCNRKSNNVLSANEFLRNQYSWFIVRSIEE